MGGLPRQADWDREEKALGIALGTGSSSVRDTKNLRDRLLEPSGEVDVDAVGLARLVRVGVRDGSLLAEVGEGRAAGQGDESGGIVQVRRCQHFVGAIGKARFKDDVLVSGQARDIRNGQREVGIRVGRNQPGHVFEKIALSVAVEINARSGVRIADAEIEDLPGVVDTVGGVGAKVVDVQVEYRDAGGIAETGPVALQLGGSEPAQMAEAAAIGALGGMLLAVIYRAMTFQRMRESVYLTVRTTAMVCWLFVGSYTFSSVFSYLGGEHVIAEFVTGLDLTPLQFLLLAQLIIFLLGWPLEWSEIIIIFVPIFLPLLPMFGIDPLFFGILVALNLQTSFLTPPMAMSAYYLKGIAPPSIQLTDIFKGVLPFLFMVIVCMVLMYMFPQIVFHLPELFYGG